MRYRFGCRAMTHCRLRYAAMRAMLTRHYHCFRAFITCRALPPAIRHARDILRRRRATR